MRIIPLLLLFSFSFGALAGKDLPSVVRRSQSAEIMVGSRSNPDGTSSGSDLTSVSSVAKDQASNVPISNALGMAFIRSAQAHKDRCKEQTCTVVKPEPEDHLKFGISFINYNQSLVKNAPPKDCSCIENEVRDELSKSSTDFETAKTRERENINKKILDSYGKKFVNQFAANLEDVTFLLNQSKDMFADQGKALSYQCNEASRFSEKIASVCKRRNITDQDFIKKRKELFINARTDKVEPFDDRFESLTLDILAAEKNDDYDNRKSQEDTQSNANMSRVAYDSARMGLVKQDPQALFMRSFIDKLLKNPAYNRKIDESLASGKTPAEALINLVKESKESSQYFKNLGMSEDANKYLKDDKAIEVSFKFMMLIHPGINMAFMDTKAFENLRKVVKPNSNVSFFDAINSTPNVLEPIVADRCQKMVDEFAEAVCTKDEDIITKVDPDELELLMHQPENENDPPLAQSDKPEMHELLICEAKIKKGQVVLASLASGFGSLGIRVPGMGGTTVGRESDYVANSGNRRAGFPPGHTLYGRWNRLAANDGKFRDRIGLIIDRNNETRTGFDGPGIAANKVYAEEVMNGSSMKLGNSSLSKEQASKYIADNKKWEDKKLADSAANNSVQKSSPQIASNEAQDKSSQNAQSSTQPQNLAAPQTNTTVAPNYANSTANSKQAEQSRDQLRQYLADKNDPGLADKTVSALDDSSAQELNKLRNERQSLLEQQLKDGEARLKDLRSQLSDAASKVQSPVADRNIASIDDEQDSDDTANSSSVSSGRNPRTIDQRQAIGGGSIGGGQVSSNAGGASTSGSKSGSVVSTNKVSKEAADTEAQVANSPNAQGDTGSVVITATDVKASGTLPAQELNQEVQKFLASSNLSSSSIQDIKSKGIKIRFNVMENNKLVQKEVIVKYDSLDQETRNQIDLKLARNNVKNQISKLTVLKLLISSSTNR